MTITSRVAVGLAAVLMTATVAAQNAPKPAPAPLAGKWEGVRQGGEGGAPETITLVFDVTEKTFTGTMFRQGREFGKITNGAIDGAKVTWQVKELDFTGAITGTTMHVTIDLANGPIEFDVKKQDKA